MDQLLHECKVAWISGVVDLVYHHIGHRRPPMLQYVYFDLLSYSYLHPLSMGLKLDLRWVITTDVGHAAF